MKAVPDLVRVRFKVVRLEQKPGQAFAAAGAAVNAVRRSLRSHGVPDAGVNSSRLRMRSEWGFPSGKRTFLGYQCEAGFAIESADLDGVQSMLVDLIAAGANEIEAVDFDVVAKPQLRAQARGEAVAAARRKAELYAEAAGVRLGAVVHIEDVNPEQLNLARGHAGMSASSEEDLSPGHVVVSAAVILGFALAQ